MTISFEQATAIIRQHFNAQWASLTAIALDDVPFDIPNGQTWVRLSIQHAMGYQATTGAPGSNAFRREGLVTVQIFQPSNQGGYDARAKAEIATAIFQRPRVNGVLFHDVTLKEVGNTPDGWYHVNIKAQFEYDTIA
ncbi:MAG: phage tail terminator-like protein [Janthinobacterium lividum]